MTREGEAEPLGLFDLKFLNFKPLVFQSVTFSDHEHNLCLGV